MPNKTIKVLYVDDEPINLDLFKINFSYKYDILTSINGEQGLETLSQNSDIVVVVSDMRMPKMSGLEFINKARTEYPHIKYYILTGFELTPEIDAAIASGVVKSYFRKPFDIHEIDNEIKKALS